MPTHILLIDDDPEFAKFIQLSLKRAGYHVQHLSSGEDVLKQIRINQNIPDLILLDINLKDMVGYEVCEKIQANDRWSFIPVIFLSGEKGADSRLKAFQSGAVGYLSKPVRQEDLLDQIKKALEVRTQWLENFVSAGDTVIAPFEPQALPEPPQQENPLPQQVSQTQSSYQPQLTQSNTTAADLPSDSKFLVPVTKVNPSHIPQEVQPSHLLPDQKKVSLSDFNGFVNYFYAQLNIPPDHTLTPDNLYLYAMHLQISQEQMVQWISIYTGLPWLKEIHPEQLKLGVLPLPFCRRYQLVPFQSDENVLAFLMPHPFNIEVADAIRRFRGAKSYLAPPDLLNALLEGRAKPEKTLNASETMSDLSVLMDEVKVRYSKPGTSPLDLSDEDANEIYLSNSVIDAPLVRLVNRIIEEAYIQRASDIHIEPWEDCVMVRYRIDGNLKDIHRLTPQTLILPLSARIKVMSELNLAERRLPQDGRIVFKEYSRGSYDFDLRVAIAPMNFGEKIVMRIIDKHKSTLPLEKLGFSSRHLQLYRTLLKSPYGMILHVGPTGSGKSMTLYSALNELNHPEINIQTAEDPIEYTLPRINQLQVHPEIGLTFARALRAYLRQDPDVILVGEIRDKETAHIAIEAALTGHLLLSTLHTNDAASTLTRFVEMGIEPFMVSSSILLICAQRLMRTLCIHCREPYTASPLELKQLGLEASQKQILYRPGGCHQCMGSGYHGRIGVHEILIPTDAIRTALNTPGMNADTLKKMAVAQGMTTLYWDAMEKVIQGLTTIEEALARVRPDEFDSRPSWWNTAT